MRLQSGLFRRLRRLAWGLPIRTTEICHNYIIETENYFLEGHIFNRDLLVVTFENSIGGDSRPDKFRKGWGFEPLRKRQISCLCIKPKRTDWYTRPDLVLAFEELRPHFRRFRRIVTYGASMGGFAALTYADLIGATEVHAMGPQSTMSPSILQGEIRFPKSRAWSFDGPYGDAVGKYGKARRVFVYFDRAHPLERLQCNRLAAPNVTFVNMPFAGHSVAQFTVNAGAMVNIVDAIETGRFDAVGFYAALRTRRTLPAYYKQLREVAKGNERRRTDIDRLEKRWCRPVNPSQE